MHDLFLHSFSFYVGPLVVDPNFASGTESPTNNFYVNFHSNRNYDYTFKKDSVHLAWISWQSKNPKKLENLEGFKISNDPKTGVRSYVSDQLIDFGQNIEQHM